MTATDPDSAIDAPAAATAVESVNAAVSELSPGRRGGESLSKVVLPPLVFAAAVIGFLYLLKELVPERRKILVPHPHRIVTDALDSDIRVELWEGLQSTAKVALTGLGLSIVIGCIFAILMSQAKWVERSFFPWAVVMQTVPILAIVPLIKQWFGFDFKSRVIVTVLISLFPIITNTLFGLKSVDPDLHDLFTLHKADRLTRLRKLLIPAALPAAFTGFRIAAGLSVIGAIVGEFFFVQGDKGLGNLVDKYRGLVQIEELYATIVLSSILGIVVFFAFGWIGRIFTRDWHEAATTDI